MFTSRLPRAEYIYMSGFNIYGKRGDNFTYEVFKDDTLVSKLSAESDVWNEGKKKWTLKKWDCTGI